MRRNGHSRSQHIVAAALCASFTWLSAVTDAAADKASPSPLSTDDWSLSISPYTWGASLEGSIAPFPGAPEADVDVSFSDILKHLDLAGMVIAQLRYERFAGYMDLVYTDVSADQNTPLGILFDDVDLESEVFIGTVGGAYRPIETDHASLDLLVGVRVWYVDTDLKLRGGLLPDQDFENNENWVDPVIGLHGHYQFDNGIFLTNLIQVGGFGAASDLTWDALGAVGYQFKESISAIAGYRHLEVDYHHNGFVFDVELSGPVIGMTILF
jgi:hypothetical protein